LFDGTLLNLIDSALVENIPLAVFGGSISAARNDNQSDEDKQAHFSPPRLFYGDVKAASRAPARRF
jgi:hypothetical protein